MSVCNKSAVFEICPFNSWDGTISYTIYTEMTSTSELIIIRIEFREKKL